MEENKVNEQINDFVGDNVKKLAQLFPSVVKDGEVDFEALKEELGEFKEVENEKYELTWAGKQEAKRIAQEDIVGKTLKYIPEESKDADTTENLYIEGDNLEVLKLLRQNYYGAIKMIYIDPPYNTGNDFVYNDSFKMSKEESDLAEGVIDELGERYTQNKSSSNRYHANWMNMMYPRLKVARDLLTDDGVIFISIDDNEIKNVRNVCDEVFGETNFIATIVWQKIHSTKNDAKYFSENHEYAIVYSKQIENIKINLLPRTDEMNSRYKNPDNDIRGPWQSGDLVASGERSNGHFIVKSPKTGKEFDVPKGKHWVYSQENLQKLVDDNQIWFGEQGNSFPRKKRFLSDVQDGRTPNTLWLAEEVGHNQTATREVKSLFDNNKIFDFPKPVEYLKQIISLGSDKNSIILDFFSGSGTTADAVIQLNKIEKCNRKFILVQLPERCSEESETFKMGYDTISDVGKERIRRAGEKIKTDSNVDNLDVGFKVFRVSDTNIKWNSEMLIDKQIDFNSSEYTPDLLDFMPGVNDIDIVYELMLRQRDVALSEKLDRLSEIGERTYLYASSFLICLETEITEGLIDKLAALEPLPIKFIFRDSAFKDDIALKDETFRRLKMLVDKNSGTNKSTYTVEFI